MSLAKTRPEDRPHWERTDEENKALFDAAIERGDAFPDPMPGATDEERRRELDRLLQEGINDLEAGRFTTLRTGEDFRRFSEELMAEVQASLGER